MCIYNIYACTAQEVKFYIKDFYSKILYGKLHFLCSDVRVCVYMLTSVMVYVYMWVLYIYVYI